MAKKPKAEQAFGSIQDMIKHLNEADPGIVSVEKANMEKVKFRTTNLSSLDWIMGGGTPLGRVLEIYGPESSGKTSLALHMLGICQRLGGKTAYLDIEMSWEPEYAMSHSLDPEELLIGRPETAEKAFDLINTLVKNGFNMIVLDSVAALTPEEEANATTGKMQIGLQARIMSKALRKLTTLIKKYNCTVIFINQTRVKIGVVFGNPETTPGGNALKFYSSIRMNVKKIDWIGGKDKPTGIHQRIKCIKNKVSPPFRTCELYMTYKRGYSVARDLIEIGSQFGVIDQKGRTYYFGNIKLGVGDKDAAKFIKKDRKVRLAIKKQVKKCFDRQDDGDEDE